MPKSIADYYFLRIKKEYATSVIKDLQKLDAIELVDSSDWPIPEWQQKEALSRLKALKKNPEQAIEWNAAMKEIKRLGTQVS